MLKSLELELLLNCHWLKTVLMHKCTAWDNCINKNRSLCNASLSIHERRKLSHEGYGSMESNHLQCVIIQSFQLGNNYSHFPLVSSVTIFTHINFLTNISILSELIFHITNNLSTQQRAAPGMAHLNFLPSSLKVKGLRNGPHSLGMTTLP